MTANSLGPQLPPHGGGALHRRLEHRLLAALAGTDHGFEFALLAPGEGHALRQHLLHGSGPCPAGEGGQAGGDVDVTYAKPGSSSPPPLLKRFRTYFLEQQLAKDFLAVLGEPPLHRRFVCCDGALLNSRANSGRGVDLDGEG